MQQNKIFFLFMQEMARKHILYLVMNKKKNYLI